MGELKRQKKYFVWRDVQDGEVVKVDLGDHKGHNPNDRLIESIQAILENLPAMSSIETVDDYRNRNITRDVANTLMWIIQKQTSFKSRLESPFNKPVMRFYEPAAEVSFAELKIALFIYNQDLLIGHGLPYKTGWDFWVEAEKERCDRSKDFPGYSSDKKHIKAIRQIRNDLKTKKNPYADSLHLNSLYSLATLIAHPNFYRDFPEGQYKELSTQFYKTQWKALIQAYTQWLKHVKDGKDGVGWKALHYEKNRITSTSGKGRNRKTVFPEPKLNRQTSRGQYSRKEHNIQSGKGFQDFCPKIGGI